MQTINYFFEVILFISGRSLIINFGHKNNRELFYVH